MRLIAIVVIVSCCSISSIISSGDQFVFDSLDYCLEGLLLVIMLILNS